MKKQYINFLKFISIILVICIHIISKLWNIYPLTSNEFRILTMLDCFCRICVPIFAMCSGVIFLNRNDKPKNIFLKYILKIYLIFIIFNLLYKIFDYIYIKDGIINVKIIFNFILDSILLKSIYHLWYLKIVIIIYSSILIFKYFINKNKRYIENILLFLLVTLFIVLPTFITNAYYVEIVNLIGYITYFYLGYYLYKYKNLKMLLFLFILSIISYIDMYNNTINSSEKTEYFMRYLSINVCTMSSFVFLFVSRIENVFEKDKIKKILNFESKHNFNIYLIHGFVIGGLQYIKLIDIYNYKNIYCIFVYVIITYIICLIVSVVAVKTLNILNRKCKLIKE